MCRVLRRSRRILAAGARNVNEGIAHLEDARAMIMAIEPVAGSNVSVGNRRFTWEVAGGLRFPRVRQIC